MGTEATVTQADRNAAAAYVRDKYGDDLLASEILRGTCDHTSKTVQAFARHRVAHSAAASQASDAGGKLDDEIEKLAVKVLHAYRKRDGLTCYNYEHNRQRDERYMRETFAELVAPFIRRATLTAPPTSGEPVQKVHELTSGEALTQLQAMGQEFDGEEMRLREALAGLVKWSDNIMRAHGVTGEQIAVTKARAALTEGAE